ncbi:MAG: hypothetical protein WB729_04105 [Candidatus Sulfotelmatobacter sp.]
MSIYLTKTMFEENLNTKFWLLNEGSEPYAMDLFELTDGYSTPRQEQFSLHFRGDCNQIFPQRIYPIRHDAIGDFDLFLVPVGRDETGTLYEAVFHRMIRDQDQAK